MEKKEALEKKICPIDGTSLGSQAGKIICENDECDFISDFAEVKELLGYNPYSVTIRLISCKEHIEWMDEFGVVQTDEHDWVETEDNETRQVLKCAKCKKESIATKPPTTKSNEESN